MVSMLRIGRWCRRWSLWGSVMVLAVMMGCAKEYDLHRPDFERGSLGEELYAIWYKDTLRSSTDAEERTALLEQREEDFVQAVDHAVPRESVGELDEFLVAFLPVIEDGYLPALTRRFSLVLEEAVADEELMDSLENPPTYGALDFLSPRVQASMIQEMVEFSDLPALISHLGYTLLELDGLTADGDPNTQNPASGYADFLRALVMAIEDPPAEETTDRWATTLRDLFLRADNRYRDGEPSRHHYVALFDDEGLPVVVKDDGEIPSPFVDSTGDGRADTDEEGRFILEDGSSLAIAPLSTEPIDHPAFQRDFFSRVELVDGPHRYAFRYVDISDTALPYVMRMAGKISHEGALYRLSKVALEVFGPPVVGVDARGNFRAFPQDHPVLDLLDAVISGLSISELPEVMELTKRYISQEIDQLAYLAHVVGNVAGTFSEYPQIDIYPDETLAYDLLAVVRELSEDPQLWADVMEAMRDPILEEAGESMATLVRYSDLHSVPVPAAEGGAYDACFEDCKDQYEIGTIERFECIRGCPMEELFSELTDFDAPKSANEPNENRSRFQRLFHLLRDTTGASYAVEIVDLDVPDFNIDPEALPPVASLPGAAEAFIRSVAGELYLGDYIDQEGDLATIIDLLNLVTGGSFNNDTVVLALSEITEAMGARLDPYPTPDQITRLFNMPDLRVEGDDFFIDIANPVCNDGFVMAFHHADGLYTAEASGLIDVLHPLARAFAKHDREDLLAQIFLVIHDHYASRDDYYVDVDGDPSPMKASNLVSAEPAMLEIFEDGEIFEALRVLALSTESMTDDEGVSIDERLRQLVYQWVRNDDGYTPRNEPFVIELRDGRILEEVSRMEVILDRYNAMIRRVEDDEDVRRELARAMETFFEVVLAADQTADGYVFREEGVVALTTHWLGYLGERARQMEERGEFEPWLTQTVPDRLTEFYGSRGFFAFLEILAKLHEDEDGRRMMRLLPGHLSETGDRADRVSMALYALIVQALDTESLMPAGRFMAGVLDPDREVEVGPHRKLPNGTLLAHLLATVPEIDDQGYGLDILARGSERGEERDSSWSVLFDILVRYFSPPPSVDDELDRAQREAALSRIGDWFRDSRSGMERFYELVEVRGVLELEPLVE